MAKFELYESLDLSLPGRQYPIIICRNGLSNPELLRPLLASNQVFIVSDQKVAPLYLKDLQNLFAPFQCNVLILEEGEQHKNQSSLSAIYEALIQNRHHRDTTLIALGGGVIGDLTGFAASTYQRGVRLIQIPTTLLSQIDASVGGKTAINHPLGKNLIGSFYQPYAVIIDLNTLESLPQREFRAGLAEMIKYGLLSGGRFLEELTQALKEGLTAKSPQLASLIAQSCRIKAQFVEADEKEEGQRALLNLGHTFAHALEAYTHYQHWLHGEAVAIGLYCAAMLSYQIGLIKFQSVEQLVSLLENAGLVYKIPSFIDLKQLRALMNVDKKIKNKNLRFVLIKEPGFCYLEDKIKEEALEQALLACLE